MIAARFADMSFIHCKREVSYCRRCRDALDAKVIVEEGVPLLRC